MCPLRKRSRIHVCVWFQHEARGAFVRGENSRAKSFFVVNEVRKTVRLGKYRDGSSASFSGQITDVNIWSYALTSYELEKWTSCQVKSWARSADIGQYTV